MSRIHEKDGRFRTINTSKDPKVFTMYAIQGSTKKDRRIKVAQALRSLADDIENGEFELGHRYAVVMDKGEGGYWVEYFEEPGHEREKLYWNGFFHEIAKGEPD